MFYALLIQYAKKLKVIIPIIRNISKWLRLCLLLLSLICYYPKKNSQITRRNHHAKHSSSATPEV